MAARTPRLIGTALTVVFLVVAATPAHADPTTSDGCYTIGTTEPDGVPRYVRVCYPPE